MSKKRKALGTTVMAVRKIVSDFGRAFGQPLLRTVRPIIAERGERAELVGSSVLLRVGDRHFALSAAHVADEAGELLIAGDTASFYLPPFLKSVAPHGDRTKDALDVAVVELPKELVFEMGGVRFLEMNELDVDDQAAPGPFYAFIGYPSVAEGYDHERKHFDPIATVYTNPEQTTKLPRPFTAATHVAMLFKPQKTIGADGRLRAIPNQRGVSGGGMWRVDALKPGNSPNKLVAITIYAQTSGTRLMIGTRVALHLEAIRNAYPDLDSGLPQASHLRINVSAG